MKLKKVLTDSLILNWFLGAFITAVFALKSPFFISITITFLSLLGIYLIYRQRMHVGGQIRLLLTHGFIVILCISGLVISWRFVDSMQIWKNYFLVMSSVLMCISSTAIGIYLAFRIIASKSESQGPTRLG
jgi:hypothetical protein